MKWALSKRSCARGLTSVSPVPKTPRVSGERYWRHGGTLIRSAPFGFPSKGTAMVSDDIAQRRAENLKAMRSAPSLALGVAGIVVMVCATVFYDRPITDKTVSFAQFRAALNDAVRRGWSEFSCRYQAMTPR